MQGIRDKIDGMDRLEEDRLSEYKVTYLRNHELMLAMLLIMLLVAVIIFVILFLGIHQEIEARSRIQLQLADSVLNCTQN